MSRADFVNKVDQLSGPSLYELAQVHSRKILPCIAKKFVRKDILAHKNK